MKLKKFISAAAIAALVCSGISAKAVTVSATGTGNNGEALSAQADFVINGSNLEITLANLGTYDPNDGQDILTAVSFDISGSPALTAVSGVLTLSSTIKNGTTPGDGAIGNQLAYKSGLSGAPGNAAYGISAAGFGLFGSGDLFPNGSLPNDGGTPPDGVAYGLTTLSDSTGNDNGGISGRALIANGAKFVLSGLPEGFSLDQISNVRFQYGTSLTEINIPEPTGFVLTLAGLGLFSVIRRKRS